MTEDAREQIKRDCEWDEAFPPMGHASIPYTQDGEEEIVGCYFCGQLGAFKEMFEVDVDVRGNSHFLCEGCYHTGMLG